MSTSFSTYTPIPPSIPVFRPVTGLVLLETFDMVPKTGNKISVTLERTLYRRYPCNAFFFEFGKKDILPVSVINFLIEVEGEYSSHNCLVLVLTEVKKDSRSLKQRNFSRK